MKLTDLNPRWVTLEKGGPIVALGFDCPHCRKTRLVVNFHHNGHEAVEDEYILAHSPSTNHIWEFTGDSFENVSLSPSVDASTSGHWHGHVTAGEIKTC